MNDHEFQQGLADSAYRQRDAILDELRRVNPEQVYFQRAAIIKEIRELNHNCKWILYAVLFIAAQTKAAEQFFEALDKIISFIWSVILGVIAGIVGLVGWTLSTWH
jgi:hypothetical protein